MHAARERFMPKHQVLILKCYPRYQKGVPEVKPNPSELSYLLYYASTRRSKIQKVGAYLEKKSSSDVYRARVGYVTLVMVLADCATCVSLHAIKSANEHSNVQVTLHIIRALIDKSPRDLPLYGPYVLRILNLILRSKNLQMVEDSVLAFESFCEHHEAALLTADQEVAKEFEDLVRGYASLAGKSQVPGKAPSSKPVALKWRTAGLRAIKCIAASEAIGMSPFYLNTVMPAILETLHADNNEWLLSLKHKGQEGKEIAKRRRMSTATAQTAESIPEEPIVSTTTADADRQGEEEAGLLAFESLEQIYSSSNRPQIRWATSALIEFIVQEPQANRPQTGRPSTARTISTHRSNFIGNWSLTLMETVTHWAPVQDRFVIMITLSESLVKTPATEENMHKHLVLANVIEWLLGSTINMIGLSVMDILLTLIQQILLILQLGGRGTNVLPHPQPTEAIDIFEKAKTTDNSQTASADDAETPQEASTPSAVRQELLKRLRQCIGNLATHIYYSDQIRDIISAIIFRLKPPINSSVANAAAAIERPDEAAQAIAESAKLSEDPGTDHFFSFGTARVAALNAIRDVLTTANNKGIVTGAGAIGRSRVSVNVWEGTQWLLRDEDKRVQRAYVDVILTWLRLEVSKKDLRVVEHTAKPKKKSANGDKGGKEILRSVSSASPNNKPNRIAKSTFLQLLHLAVYDNALEGPEDDSNILLMHLLLSSLVQKLGVNTVKTGLPMIVRLQEDINFSPELNSPKAKINVGSLVHGYFWALSDAFDIDTTMVGYQIQNEIIRRQKAGLWLVGCKVPPQPLEMIFTGPQTNPTTVSSEVIDNETLKPFDSIQSTVQQIASSYAESVASPPGSPPLSPGRVFTMPLASITGEQRPANELPPDFKEAMLSKWSKEQCIAAAEKSTARTISPHGSRTGTTRSAPNGLLTADGAQQRDASPSSAHQQSKTRGRIPSAFRPLQTDRANRHEPNYSGPHTPVSDSSNHTGTLRVDDLKRVLAGGALADALSSQPQSSVRNSSPLRNSQTAIHDFAAEDTENLGRAITRPSVVSVATDSMMEAEGFESASEGDLDHPLPSPQSPIESSEIARQYVNQHSSRPHEYSPHRNSHGSDRAKQNGAQQPAIPTSPSRRSQGSRPRSASETSTEDPEANVRALRGAPPSDVVHGSIVSDEGVPPVPPLPEGLIKKNNLGVTNGNSFMPAQQSAVASSTALTYTTARERDIALDNLALENRPKAIAKTDSILEGSGRGSLHGSYEDSLGRRSLRAAGPEKKSMVQALLGSIEVGDVGGKGIGKPPY